MQSYFIGNILHLFITLQILSVLSLIATYEVDKARLVFSFHFFSTSLYELGH